MKNYVTSNLIQVTPEAYKLAVRVDDKVFMVARPGDIDVRETTATSKDVIRGKTFFGSNGQLVRGAIQYLDSDSYMPTTYNQYISEGAYISGTQTILGDPALIGSNIKAGTSIFNVTGIFTADATATAGDIAQGLTAYINGQCVTGTLQIEHKANLFKCTSVQEPFYVHLEGDSYGGNYYYDGLLQGGQVFTNGAYYIMPQASSGGVGRNTGSWCLKTSKDRQQAPLIQSFDLYGSAIAQDSSGTLFIITPETRSAGHWTGNSMAIQSDTGYYEQTLVSDSLLYSHIVPEIGQIYSPDALAHVDKIWDYNYKRDLKGFFGSTQNQMHPAAYEEFEGVSGPDAGGWFTFGAGALGNYSGYNYDGGVSLFSAKFDNFTFAFKFKYAAGTLNGDPNYNCIFRLGGSDDWGNQVLLQISVSPDGTMNIANRATAEGDTQIPYTLQADTEYSFVVVCAGAEMIVSINDNIVARWRSIHNEAAISTVYVHWYGGNASEASFSYKEMSLWGRALYELLPQRSDSVSISNTSFGSGTFLLSDKYVSAHLDSSGYTRLLITSGGTLQDTNVPSCMIYGNISNGVYVFSGGKTINLDVSAGGIVAAYSGAFIDKITISSGGYLSVNNGASAVSVLNQGSVISAQGAYIEYIN